MESFNSRPARIALCAIVLILAAGLLPHTTIRAQAPPAYANFEGAQTNPIRLSADRTRLFAVNTPNATVSVFDVTNPAGPALIAQIPVGLEPVSVNPRTDDEVWVVNQISNSISVVSVSKGIVTDTIPAVAEPMDVVFAGGLAYVSVSRNNLIAAFDVNTHARVASIPLAGGDPRALAVSLDGSKVYVAFAISGNATTIIPQNLAPPQSPPTNPALPPPPQVGLIIKYNDPNWSKDIQFTMPDHDVAVIATGATPALKGYYSGVGTILLGMALNPTNGDIYVSNTDALNLIHFETNLQGHFVNNRITQIAVASGQITPFDLNPAINYSILPNPAALAIALAQPAGIAFDPSGSFMWVAAFGTDRVAQVDTNGNVLSRIEIAQPSGAGTNVDPKNKKGPRGLALNAGSQKLYVLNRISNTISVVDTNGKTVLGEIAVGADPTPADIHSGRGFLYDAKLSGNGTGSCASCHVDGDMDHLAWDLGNPGASLTTVTQGSTTFTFHPMKGPMTTQTLRGLNNLAPYHWRGDHANFAAFNPAFTSLMGGPQLSTSDMQLYMNFVNSILFQPNPYRNVDDSFPAAALDGKPTNEQFDFANLPLTGLNAAGQTCNFCHTTVPAGPGSNLLIQQLPGAPQPLKTPQLRNEYQKELRSSFASKTGRSVIDGFGLDHDGTASSLTAFMDGPAFTAYTAQEKLDIVAFMLCFDTGTAPSVGYTLTITTANVGNSTVQSNWSVLQAQATAGNNDVIARGTLSGQVHGLVYHPELSGYLSDTGAFFTQAQLQTLIQNGDTLSFMGVYPGTGSATVQE